MSEKAKGTISLGIIITIFVMLIGVIFTFFQMLRTADVQASADRDTQLSKRVDNLEIMQKDITELKIGQERIMTAMGIKNISKK